MSKQIQIYLAPEDVIEFERVLKLIGVLILERTSRLARPVLLEAIEAKREEANGLDNYLVRSDQLDSVLTRAVPKQGCWTIDSLHSPVIEFSGCHFDGKTLKRGRLFYDEGYYDDRGIWIDKPDQFLLTGKEIFRLARQMFRKDRSLDAYVGPKAGEWRERSQGAFVPLSFARMPTDGTHQG